MKKVRDIQRESNMQIKKMKVRTEFKTHNDAFIHKKKIKGAIGYNKLILYLPKKDLKKLNKKPYFVADILITNIQERVKGKHNGQLKA